MTAGECDLPAFLRRIAWMQWDQNWEPDILAAADRIETLEAESARLNVTMTALEAENHALRERLNR